MDLDVEAIAHKHADEIRGMWQAKALATADGKTFVVLLSVLAHNFDDGMEVLLRVVFPGFTSIMPPFLSTAGKITKGGHIVADMVGVSGKITKRALLYRNETELRDDFRRLADHLKLDDADRASMFAAVRRWVVCDFRIDPMMDPRDPEAKHLVH